MEWRDALRANLTLWPNVTPNLVAVAQCAGKPLNEEEFLLAIKDQSAVTTSVQKEGEVTADDDGAAESKLPATARSVRQTVEILVLGGLAFRDESGIFRLSTVGKHVLDFLVGSSGQSKQVNENNYYLAGRALLPGLMAVPEYRASILLTWKCDEVLSTEEFNRAIPHLSRMPAPDLSRIDKVAALILAAREKNDVSKIGARWYKDEDFGTSSESDQRKAVNPWFLLAGGGGLVLEGLGNSQRRLHPLLVDDVRRIAMTVAPYIDLPKKNVIEASKEYSQAFSERCLY